MARLIALIVILLVGFYVVWPGWSVYQIATALDTGDEATLSRKIVFKDVRAALRPAVEAKLTEAYDKLQSRTGEVGALLAGLRAQAVPAIATAALDTLVTPETFIDMAKDDRMLKENLQQLIAQSKFEDRYETWKKMETFYYKNAVNIKFGDYFTLRAMQKNVKNYVSMELPFFWNVWLEK